MIYFDQISQKFGEIRLSANQIDIDVSFEQYRKNIAKKEKKIRGFLIDSKLSNIKKINYEKYLDDMKQQSLNERKNYEAYAMDLKKRVVRLVKFTGKLPKSIINAIKQALSNGDNEKAEQLFIQIEKQENLHITAIAEAIYQRGKIAEDKINYNDAFSHYKRATELTPYNPLYLLEAGSAAGKLTNYVEEIKLTEQALEIYIKQDSGSSSAVVTCWNNLGMAWAGKGRLRSGH